LDFRPFGTRIAIVVGMRNLKIYAYLVLLMAVFVVGVGATIWTSRSIDPITDFLLQGERAGSKVVVPATPSNELIDC
jgi:hypothetical protein